MNADSPRPLTAMYHTLGCKLNFAETSTIATMLEERGIRRATECECPDIIVVNTCSVTAEADKKDRQIIRSLSRRYPQAAIVVTGCYAQLCAEQVATLPNVAVVGGNDRKGLIAEYVDRWLRERSEMVEVTPSAKIRDFTPACSRGDRTRYFLKVQDGCDYWCTYCTIPKARGRSRSASVAQLVHQAQDVARSGGREIVITGVNIGDFGKGTSENFLDLIRALDTVDGIERYRISSIEPNLLTPEIIEFVAQSQRFMPHFHIPLQAGSDQVLSLMHRRYDTALFAGRVHEIRRLIPDAFIGVDLIAGMRGETAELFQCSLDFVRSLPISRLHVFPYSERPGTKALEIAHVVSQEEKYRRVARMTQVSDAKLEAFSRQFEGTVRKVLLEHPDHNGAMGGFTDNYLRVNLSLPRPELSNTVVEVLLEKFDPETEEFTGSLKN